MQTFTLPPGQPPCPAVRLLRQEGYSRTQIRKLKNHAAWLLDGQPARSGDLVRPGQTLSVSELPSETSVYPQALPVAVIYEDDYLLAVDKPAGMLSHPTVKEARGTLCNFLADYSRERSGFDGLHILSRLDRGTSGLMLIAKTARLQHLLSRAPICKTYRALLQNPPPAAAGVINLPIARKPGSIIERVVSPDGKPALTCYALLAVYPDGRALVEFTLKTGRTHQIRVHAAALGCPLRGDDLYGAPPGSGYFLRAQRLSFRHPITGRVIELDAPPLPGNTG
jgi:23S rRNA pseudouridine1911/1915/1917 synthase